MPGGVSKSKQKRAAVAANRRHFSGAGRAKHLLGICGRVWHAQVMRHCIPCVGLVVFLGCFTFIIAPDYEGQPRDKSVATSPGALPTIVIDPGHGGNDEGTKFFHLAEKDLTLDIATRLEKTLQRLGFSTVLTRHDDHYVALSERVATANKIGNSIFVSIHFNSSSSGMIGGVETYYADQKLPLFQDWTWVGWFSHADQPALDSGETLAGFIQASLVSRMEVANRGIKSRSLYVVRHTRAPAVLVEAGFISNPIENQLLRIDSYRERIANSIAEGVLSYERTQHPSAVPPQKLASTEASARKN